MRTLYALWLTTVPAAAQASPASAAPNASELVLSAHAWPGLETGTSAFPSWQVTGDGPPALLVTRAGADGGARLVLSRNDSGQAREHVLAEGKGWLLNWADVPATARLASGAELATWLELEPAHAHAYGTRFRALDAARERRSEPRPLEEHRGPGEHGFVSLAPLDAERFLALWLDGRAAGEHGAGDTRVYARSVARDGTLGAEMLVDPRACSCCPTALVRLADGTHLAAWRDRDADEVRDIAVARFDGERWSEPTRLHEDGWRIDGCPVNGPRLASNGQHLAASWYTGADGSVRASFADALGRSFGPAVRVDEGAPEGRGDCAFLPDGALLVGWMEHGTPRSRWCVRRVSPSGELGAVQTVIEVSAERASGFLRMCADREGVWLATTATEPEKRVLVTRVSLAR